MFVVFRVLFSRLLRILPILGLFMDVFEDFYAQASTLYLQHTAKPEISSLANSLLSKVSRKWELIRVHRCHVLDPVDAIGFLATLL